jgi:ABC-type branched-subunit amino acid transport system ATPase component
MSATPVLETRGLVAGYVPEVDILHSVDLRVLPGELVTIVGPNGAGKSTLIRAMIGLLRPRAGTVLLAGEDITGVRANRVVSRGVGYVAQRENVFASMSVEHRPSTCSLGYPMFCAAWPGSPGRSGSPDRR